MENLPEPINQKNRDNVTGILVATSIGIVMLAWNWLLG